MYKHRGDVLVCMPRGKDIPTACRCVLLQCERHAVSLTAVFDVSVRIVPVVGVLASLATDGAWPLCVTVTAEVDGQVTTVGTVGMGSSTIFGRESHGLVLIERADRSDHFVVGSRCNRPGRSTDGFECDRLFSFAALVIIIVIAAASYETEAQHGAQNGA